MAGLTGLLAEHGGATCREVTHGVDLEDGPTVTPVGTGSIAHVPHRVVDVTDDLRVVLVLAPPGPG